MLNSLSLFVCFRKIPKRRSNVFLINPSCNFSLSTKQNDHYKTLKLSRNCTGKDIREAFISLSKEYHPDKNKDNPKAQEQFVKINEAYNVLIKSESRREYDQNLHTFGNPSKVYRSPHKSDYYEVHRYDSDYKDPWKDPSFYRNRKWQENNNDNFYGVKGMKKMPNQQILFWLITFAGVGLFLQILIIRFSGVRSIATYDKVTRDNSQYLDYVRRRADIYGSREQQIDEYKLRAGIKDKEE